MLWVEARHVVVHGDEASPVGSISALDSDGACVVADGDARVNGGVCGSVDVVDNPDSFHIAVAGDEDGSSGLCGLPGRIVWVPSGYPASFALYSRRIDPPRVQGVRPTPSCAEPIRNESRVIRALKPTGRDGRTDQGRPYRLSPKRCNDPLRRQPMWAGRVNSATCSSLEAPHRSPLRQSFRS
jgi:hypothetical protein